MSTEKDRLPELSPYDQRLVDALVDAGFDESRLEPLTQSQRQRVDAILHTFELMEDYPVDDVEQTLVHATLARIDRHEHHREERLRIEAVEEAATSTGRRIRIPDFISVAAALLIVASIAWPLTNKIRNDSIDQACANNMRLLGYAFSQYAGDHNNAMPVAHAGLLSNWNHNTVNLNPLIDNRYCEHNHLNCPGDHLNDGVSYGYQVQMPDRRPIWDNGRGMVILGDRNPVIDAIRKGEKASPLSISLNHNGRGQWVLSSDGSTLWLMDPVTPGGDNIWLPRGVDELSEDDAPTDPSDVFLAQ